jgi:branched-chain amino acid transport system permease protein
MASGISAVPGIIVGGLVPASIYAPIACGMVMVYRSSRVLNFAQGGFALVGAYLFYWLSGLLHLPFWVGIVGALVLAFGIGAGLHWVVVRPVIGKGPVVSVMLTIALASVLQAVVFLVFGTDQRFLTNPVGNGVVRIPGVVTLSTLDVTIVLTTAVVLGVLWLLLSKTRIGISIRSVSDSPLLAGYWGRNASALVGLTWAVSFALSALAGVAYGLRSDLDSGVLDLGTLIFPAVIIGGMDSLGGAILGSLLLGIAIQAVTVYLGGQWSDFVVYAALLVVLTWKPFGLFGTRELTRL